MHFCQPVNKIESQKLRLRKTFEPYDRSRPNNSMGSLCRLRAALLNTLMVEDLRTGNMVRTCDLRNVYKASAPLVAEAFILHAFLVVIPTASIITTETKLRAPSL